MVVPEIKRRSFFVSPIVSLINTRNADAGSADVIENRFGDLEADTEPLKPCCKRSAKVVQPPTRHGIGTIVRNQPVECLFTLMITGKAAAR